MNKLFKRPGGALWVLIGILLPAAFVLGYLVRGGPAESGRAAEPAEAESEQKQGVIWTCSMHPQIRMPGPGKCPICFMDLIPAASGEPEADLGPRQLRMSERARRLAEVEVAPAERRFVTAEIRMVGKIQYDETKLGHITAWIPGRLDRLYVDYTGIPVRKGDHMVYVYSPELLAAQEELLQAIQAVKDLEKSDLPSIRKTAQETVEAVREKLRLWGLAEEQIREIEQRGTPTDHMTIYAPMGGIVVHKNAVEGMYVMTGTKIYTIADLSTVWVMLDAYETDLPWIRYGQEVAFETEAYPGETFSGRISFIDPILNDKTRTVRVRVEADNSDGKLKPEMLVHAAVRSRVAAGGRVMEPELAGKWISPMHPEIVKDEPGFCDVCGMPLVRAESLGYAAVNAGTEEAPLVIPDSAPLITGKRAVVYVAVPGEEGVYEGREIVLGPRAGRHYIVEEGLAEGELVVVQGNFKIDSEIQIQAKPSMMSPEGGAPPGHRHGVSEPTPEGGARGEDHTGHEEPGAGSRAKLTVPEGFRGQLEPVYAAYFNLQEALASDALAKAKAAGEELVEVLGSVDTGLVEEPAHSAWMKELEGLRKGGEGAAQAADITKAREHFHILSDSLGEVARRFGGSGERPVLRFYCPMAFENRGAHWLQREAGVENPYFGSAMLKCGEQTEVLVRPRGEGPEP